MTKNIFMILSDSPRNFSISEKKQIARSLGLAEQAIEFRVTQIAGPEEAEEVIREVQPIGFEIRVMWWDEHLWTGLGDVGSSTRYYVSSLGGSNYQWETKAQRHERRLGEENDRVSAGLMGRDD